MKALVAGLCILVGVLGLVARRAHAQRWRLRHVMETMNSALHIVLGVVLMLEIVLPLLLPLGEGGIDPRLNDPPSIMIAATDQAECPARA